MTKGTKAFRIIICILLGLTILWTAYISYAFIYLGNNTIFRDTYDIYVAGVAVTRTNYGDVLGDGKVSYSVSTNTLTFDNAVIEYDYVIVYSTVDLKINLVGENKFICKDGESISALYVSDGLLRKDLSLEGDGSLIIEYQNVTESAMGIVAEDLWIGADVTIITPDCADISNGIICTSSLVLRNKANVVVKNGASRSSTAVSVRGNVIFENGSSMDVTVTSGSTEACNGFCVDGNLVLGRETSLNVVINDDIAERSECISILGVMSVGTDATVNASAKKAYAVECSGTLDISEGAVFSASSDGTGADVFCITLVDSGATVNAEVEALGGTYSKVRN